MRLYVWRSSWNGMWYVSRDPKPETPYAAYLCRHHGKHFWTHRQAFADAWARTHPKASLVPLGNDAYRVVGAMRRSAVTGRYLTSADKGE